MLNRKSFSLCLCVFLVSALSLAAQTAVSGPMSGSIFHSSTRSIRPIVGLPGSSYLGDAVVTDIDWAAVAQNGRSALAVQGGTLLLIRGLDSEINWTAIEGAMLPDRAAFSRDGSAAAIYSSSARQVQFLRDLFGSPAAGAPIDAPAGVCALALDPSGRLLIAAVESEQEGGIYLLSQDEPARLIAPFAHPAAIALAPNGSDLFVADRASRQVLEIRNFRDSANVMQFADDPGGASEPVGIALSRDGRLLFVAGKSAKSLKTYEVASRSLVLETALDAEPSFLEPLSGNSLFLLNTTGEDKEPLMVLDANGPAVYFVPAGRGE